MSGYIDAAKIYRVVIYGLDGKGPESFIWESFSIWSNFVLVCVFEGCVFEVWALSGFVSGFICKRFDYLV